jgi:hypothetical protein
MKIKIEVQCSVISVEDFTAGANPTIVSYNASAVKIYNATCS